MNIDENISQLLKGVYFEELTSELCDFTLQEQNAAVEAQGIQPSTSSNFIPILGKSVTYIVVAVLFNQDDEVLMIQEAKESCYGKWYLPAGRMEPGENIASAAVREVLEETGLNIVVNTLLGVECAGGCWFRFILTGDVIGGNLKTLSDADLESLQANWVSNVNDLSLRSTDILSIIETGRNYKNRNAVDLWHSQILPINKTYMKNYLRIVAIIKKRSTNSVHVLLSEKNTAHFPNVEINPSRSIHSTLRKFMIEIFGSELPQHRPHGLLCVEHGPLIVQENENQCSQMIYSDGVCLTLLVVFRPALEDVPFIGKYFWHEVSKEIGKQLVTILASKHSTFPLNVVR